MKKLLATLFSILAIACMAAALSACGERPPHIWSEEWTWDDTWKEDRHWHVCLDEGCNGRTALEEHTWTLIETDIKPTCTALGEGTYRCEVCGAVKTHADIPKIEHTYVLVERVNPETCYQNGQGTYRCSVCGSIKRNVVIPATGEHVFSSEWSQDATGHWHDCETPGCTAKSDYSVHDEERVEHTPWQGTRDGAYDYYCSVCDRLVNSIIDPSLVVPVSFDLKFTLVAFRDGEETSLPTNPFIPPPYVNPVVKEENGELSVTLMMTDDYATTKLQYKLEFINGKNAAGGSVEVEGMYDLAASAGVRAWERNEYTGAEELLGLTNDRHIGYYGTGHLILKSCPTLADGTRDTVTVVFRYFTGNEDTVAEAIRHAKVTKVLRIHGVTQSEATRTTSLPSALDHIDENVVVFSETKNKYPLASAAQK